MNKPQGGQAPYGFTWLKGELIQEPLEASIYALAFELYLVHQRFGTTAKLLNRQGLRTRAVKEFSGAYVSKLLKKPIAKGIYQISSSYVDDEGNQQKEIININVTPIVSNQVWDYVGSIIAQQTTKQTRPPTQDLFIGKVVCACDALMELPSKSSQYRCPDCGSVISKEDLRAAFESHITHLPLPSHKTLQQLATTSLIEQKIDPTNMLKEVERDTQKLYDLHARDVINEDEFKRRYAPLEKRKNQLLELIKNNQTDHSPTSLSKKWKALPASQQRVLLENMVQSVHVSPTALHFQLGRYYMSSCFNSTAETTGIWMRLGKEWVTEVGCQKPLSD